MIWDCFTYNGESDLLEIRCEELKELEVTHVLIESNYTFTGKWKDLKFKNPNNYNIAYFVANHLPNNGDAWDNERAQRNYIKNALEILGAKDDDIVIISDADEIISKSAISRYSPKNSITSLLVDTYRYYLNCLEGKQNWSKAKMTVYECLKSFTPDEIRNSCESLQLENAGWHFSYVGDLDFIKNKIESFSHTELNTEEFKSKLEFKYRNNQSLFSDDYWTIVEIDESMPKYLQNNFDRFSHLIKK